MYSYGLAKFVLFIFFRINNANISRVDAIKTHCEGVKSTFRLDKRNKRVNFATQKSVGTLCDGSVAQLDRATAF